MSGVTQAGRLWLESARRAWLASPLPGFLRWWAGELLALLPAPWRDWFRRGADWYLLQPVGAGWTLRRAGTPAPVLAWDDTAEASVQITQLQQILAAVDRADRRLALLLPAAAVLRRKLSLPLAARNDLRQVLAFEMDRQTPFTAAQVYWAPHALATTATAGHFHTELVVVTHAVLDPLLAHLGDYGLAVDAVDVDSDGGRLGVNLLPPAQTPRHARPRRRLNLLLGVACVVLLGLVLGQWLHNRRVALAQMQATVASLHGEAQQVVALRQQLQDNAGAAGFLAQRKRHAVTMLSLLQEVTMRLPDSAWLERFSVDNGGQIGLQGQSQQSAKLLDALKDSPLIRDASFQGSIQPDPTTGKERFYLVAHVREPAPDPGRKPATPDSAATDTGRGS
ncbi:MAG TPA: PilN domain-containing protein [Rhodanobacter sp.]|nr:PilN domain-containing protein [Rhodanobacter sp.]